MSDQLELYCLVLNDDPNRIFLVKIANTKSVGALKKAIKEEKRPLFDNIPADSLVLWDVSISTESDKDLQKELENFEADNKKSLRSTTKLSNLFQKTEMETLHALIAPTSEYSDIQAIYLHD